jgi:hypothetical protein
MTGAATLIFSTAFERRSDYYLAVKIADDDDGKKTEKNIFIGRVYDNQEAAIGYVRTVVKNTY